MTVSSRYGWVMLVLAAFAMVATLPGRTHGLGMITERMLADPSLGIDRLAFSEINFRATLLGGLFCLPCGWLIDRLGLKTTLTVTVRALALAVRCMTRLSGRWGPELEVAILLTRGFGQSALSVISITMVGKWFSRRTTWAMSVYSLLLSLGFALSAQLARPWANADWRVVWDTMGYALLAFVPLCLILCRDPAPVAAEISPALSVPSECCAASGTDAAQSLTLPQALWSQTFWLFALSTSLVGLISSGMSLFNESVLKQQGFSKDVFYNLITLTGMVGLLTKLPIGWLGERFALNRLLAAGLILQSACLIAFPFVTTLTGVSLYGAGMGISGTITTVLFFSIWSRAFGRRHLGKIQAVAQLLTVIASASGPVLLARCLERFDSYSPAFMILAGTSACLAVWACCVSPPRPCEA
ncbi:MAG: MFS transporter [Planctomycetota bacterium]